MGCKPGQPNIISLKVAFIEDRIDAMKGLPEQREKVFLL
jgi:hypothetical protein